jgi:hypothetical protein
MVVNLIDGLRPVEYDDVDAIDAWQEALFSHRSATL